MLGRGVVVSAGGRSPLDGAERLVVGRAVLADPARLEKTVDLLHRAWAERRPVIVELGVETSELRQMVVEQRAPWMLGPGYTPLMERLHFLVWANNWDARNGDPIWWWSRKAQRLGARIGGRADIMLADGREAWVDGGPRALMDIPVVHSQTVELGRLTLQPPDASNRADLADDQRAAVEHRSGSVRVIAPAGSGKTRTLIARLLHLVDERRIEPGIVTAVAYNNRAALQMRQRLRRDDLHIRTIHSLGWAIVRDIRPDATLLNERDVRARLRDMISKTPRPNTDIVGPYLEGLSEIRIALRNPTHVEEQRDDVEGLVRIFHQYRSLLSKRNEVDYDEQVYGAIELLFADPELRRRWQKRCRHLLVDEFQDLTPAYLLLLRLLGSPELSVFGVGDDDQTIYGYAGADPSFLIEFDRYFPGAGAGALTVNYRCPSEVVTAASHLLSHNQRRLPKTIQAAADPRRDSFRIIKPSPPEMATAAAKIITRWRKEGVPAEEIAVLARVNSALLPMLAALDNAGSPFRSQLGTGLLNRTTMRATMAWIRLALNTESMGRMDLMEAVRRPARRINQVASNLIPPGDISLGRLADLANRLDERKAATWKRFVDAIKEASQVAELGNSGALLDYLSHEVGLGKVARTLDAGRSKVDRSTHTDDLVALRRTAAIYGDLPSFEARLRRLLGRDDPPEPGVTVTTIHRVKGLEWDRVIVFGVDKGLFPHLLSEDTEEERRVLHVAITRCRQQAVVVAEMGRESPFLAEMTKEARGAPDRTVRPDERDRQLSSGPERSARSLESATYERLRKWRRRTARQEDVSLDTVLTHRAMKQIARVRPSTEEALFQIAPTDSHKLEKYGQAILELVSIAKQDHPEATDSQQTGSSTQPQPLPPRDVALYNALREWRIRAARQNQISAFLVLYNRTLEEIVRTRPRTNAALLEISDIGLHKLERYGEDILRLVKSHSTESPDPGKAPHTTKQLERPPLPDRAKIPPLPRPIPPQDAALFNALREWRVGVARQSGIPAYTVLNNQTMEEIARIRPHTNATLLLVHGIGPHKLEKYGQELLAMVETHRSE